MVRDTISSLFPRPIFRVTDLEHVAPVVPHGTFCTNEEKTTLLLLLQLRQSGLSALCTVLSVARSPYRITTQIVVLMCIFFVSISVTNVTLLCLMERLMSMSRIQDDVVIILIVNEDNETTQHGKPH